MSNRFFAREQAPGHDDTEIHRQTVAGGLFPLKDGRQFLAPERSIRGGFVPRNVGHGMFALAFGDFLILPTARPWQAGLIFEGADSFFPCEFAAFLDELMPPEFALQIPTRADEFLVLAVSHFIFVNEVIIEPHTLSRRARPSHETILAAGHEGHPRRDLCSLDQPGFQADRL